MSTELDNIISIPFSSVEAIVQAKISDFLSKCPAFVEMPDICNSLKTRGVDCRADIILWIQGARTDLEQSDIKTILSYNPIEALAFSTLSEDKLELYLCVCPRNTELVLKLMLYVGIQYSPATIVWVAIPPDTLHFEEIASYLVENGFSDPELSTTTILDGYLRSPVISMVLDKTNAIYTDDSLVKVINIRNRYLSSKNLCVFDVIIPIDVALYLYDYLSETTEIAGKLIVSEYKLKYFDNRYIPVATLGFPTKSKVIGTRYAVHPPNGIFNFHTHPYHCYRDYNMSLNWPSGADMGAVFMLRQLGNMLHFVITSEGIYGIQLSAQLNLYLSMVKRKEYINYDECLIATYDSVVKFFKKFEVNCAVEQSFADNMLHEYISAANQFTFEDITQNMQETSCNWVVPNTNFKAFNFKFMSWDDIKDAGEFRMTSENIVFEHEKCPPSIGEELEAVAGGELLGNID
jgi:hypothetical protein